MENFNSYCRFCAEQKNSEKMLNLREENKLDEIHNKLSFLNAVYVDILKDNLPKTICFVCYESLNKAHEFLNNVMKAQSVLDDIFLPNKDVELYYSDDDKNFSIDTVEHEVKLEDSNELDTINVKPEPKDDTDLNVKDFFEAAIQNIPEINIYTTEDANVKKTLTKWKHYPWTCAYCNIEFLDIETLRLHSRITHGRCNAFACVYCKNFECSSFEQFITHVRKHKKKLR